MKLTPSPLVVGDDRANYHPTYDRGGIIGADPWDLGAANGSITSMDIFNVLGQFTHTCT